MHCFTGVGFTYLLSRMSLQGHHHHWLLRINTQHLKTAWKPIHKHLLICRGRGAGLSRGAVTAPALAQTSVPVVLSPAWRCNDPLCSTRSIR